MLIQNHIEKKKESIKSITENEKKVFIQISKINKTRKNLLNPTTVELMKELNLSFMPLIEVLRNLERKNIIEIISLDNIKKGWKIIA